ncbi:MAG TPA: ParA family protein [bacterium]|nr:ParA family protein [bacterium]
MLTVIGNLKGGTGKSTVTFNLALYLVAAGVSVRVFDLDPQATLSDAIDVRKEEAYTPALRLGAASELGTPTLGFDFADIGVSDMAALQRALVLADRILIPVAPSQADVWSTQRFLRMIHQARNGRPVDVLAFINRADTHPAVRETGEAEVALDMLHGLRRLPTRLYQRTTYRRSFSEGLAVFELDPSGKAAHEIAGLAAILHPVLFHPPI